MPNKNSISFAAYEKMADYYFTYIDTKPFNAYYERPAMLSLLPNVEGKAVLDAGCAAGWYSKWLVDHGAKVTAIDFSPNMIKMSQKRLGNNAHIIRADLNEPLTFIQDSVMDLVLSSLTLHYLKNWELPLAEFNRILKPAGCLVFSIHHPFMDFAENHCENYFLTELLTDTWENPEGSVKVEYYRRPLQQIFSLVLQAGFSITALLEPMPTDKFRQAQPEIYEKLTKNPHFLFVKAVKS